MARLAPTKQTIKKLFALSGNRCAFPGCTEPLVNGSGDLVADVCHIEAAEKDGERYNAKQSDKARRAFENLIVLCPTHHRTTNNVAEYPVARLQQMKQEHEAQSGTGGPEMDNRLYQQILRRLAEQVRRIGPCRLPHAAARLVGREAELQRLTNALADGHTRITSIVAWGGVGKTALVAAWAADLAKDGWPDLDAYFEWSFYSQGTRQQGAVSSDSFIAEALKHFGDAALAESKAGPDEKGRRLGQLVAARRALLVLDGIEPLQHPPHDAGLAGRLRDPAVQVLLTTLAQAAGAGRCVLTTREPVTDLARWHDTTVQEWRLDHLSEQAGAALLHQAGATRAGAADIGADDAELRAASAEVGGHALTLQLLGSYLRRAACGDIRQRKTIDFHAAVAAFKANPKDANKPYGHAFKVMRAYERWLGRRKAGKRELALLRVMGLFDRPAAPGCLEALRTGAPIPGLTAPLAGLSDVDWNATVAALEDAGLVRRSPWHHQAVRGFPKDKALAHLAASERGQRLELGEPEEWLGPPVLLADGLDAHPLVREYFGRRLHDEAPDAWREGHHRLYEYLQASVPYWPEGFAGLQPLYQAVRHGCLAGLRWEAFARAYFARILRGTIVTGEFGFYSTRELGAFGADLVAMACFFEAPWRRVSPELSTTDQVWLLNEAGFRLRAMGRLAEALEAMRAGLRTAVERRCSELAATFASNLSEMELTLGDMPKAVGDGAWSVTLADDGNDAFRQKAFRTAHADALHHAGQLAEARALFEQAETMQPEGDSQSALLHSLWGFRYCDLLLADAERAAWQRTLDLESEIEDLRMAKACDEVAGRAAQTLEWVTSRNWRQDIALDHLTLARAGLYRAILTGAEIRSLKSEIKNAVDGLRQAGTVHHLPRGLLTRALFRHHTEHDAAGCRADLDEAWEIAERGPMRLFMADIHLHRARLFRDRTALAKARELVEQCGYGRRLPELEDAQRAAQGWPAPV